MRWPSLHRLVASECKARSLPVNRGLQKRSLTVMNVSFYKPTCRDKMNVLDAPVQPSLRDRRSTFYYNTAYNLHNIPVPSQPISRVWRLQKNSTLLRYMCRRISPTIAAVHSHGPSNAGAVVVGV